MAPGSIHLRGVWCVFHLNRILHDEGRPEVLTGCQKKNIKKNIMEEEMLILGERFKHPVYILKKVPTRII